MSVKNQKLGGSNFDTPTARIKPTDLNDTFDAASKFIQMEEIQFKNHAQLLFNAARIGFNSKLNVATGVPNLKNLKYDCCLTDTATVGYNIAYDGTDKLYKTPSSLATVTYYAIVNASGGPASNISTGILRLSAGSWLIFDPAHATNSTAVQRAVVNKMLWFDALMDGDFTSVTALKVSDSGDVGFRGHKAVLTGSYGHSVYGTSYTGTFANTTTNTVSSWSNLSVSNDGDYANYANTWQCAVGTVLNDARTRGDAGGTNTINEIGTDREADEKTNPANCSLNSSGGDMGFTLQAIILCKGGISWAETGTDVSTSNVDYYTTYSIPETTQADTLENEGANGSATLIFQTTGLSTITDCIPTWNASIDGDNTLAVSISADGTNYETVTDATIHRFTNTGTNLYVKFEINRVDTAAVDKISEYAVFYNTGVAT